MSQLKRKCSSFEEGFKLRVMEFAEEHNNSVATRGFGVAETLAQTVLKKIPKTKSFPSCRCSIFNKTQRRAKLMILMQWQEGIIIRNVICFQALQLKNGKFKDTPVFFFFISSCFARVVQQIDGTQHISISKLNKNWAEVTKVAWREQGVFPYIYHKIMEVSIIWAFPKQRESIWAKYRPSSQTQWSNFCFAATWYLLE